MIKRPVWYNNLGWRKYIPNALYNIIHSVRFRGANRLRDILKLKVIDTEVWVSGAIAEFTLSKTTFIDVGSQYGRHIKYLFSHGSAETFAVACEANPYLTTKLKDNFKPQIADGRMNIVEAAIGSSNSPVKFFINTEDSGYSGLKPRQIKEVSNSYESHEAQQVKIDDIINLFDYPISCIKIDVEGAEMSVLAGAEKTLAIVSPIVIFECAKNAAPFFGSDLTTVVAWFKNVGYRVSTITGQAVDEANSKNLFEKEFCYDFVAAKADRIDHTNSVLRRISGSK